MWSWWGRESDLPELHLDGAVQLLQAGLQVHGLGVGVVQIDGGGLVLVFVDVAQVSPQLQQSTQ